ncbi:hypothetical protein ACT5YT_11060 [Leuconostoc suionicum]|uniref:hypothetical protein n=1 Tax=Leuconostoc suionicum TaxID=1511761 RepID=UPI004035BCDD
MNNLGYETISNEKLALTTGGGFWGKVAEWGLGEAASNLDQISSGYKSGYKKGRNAW